MLAALTNYPAIAGKTAAGGNQNLFSQKSLQLCGCGIVAAPEGQGCPAVKRVMSTRLTWTPLTGWASR